MQHQQTCLGCKALLEACQSQSQLASSVGAKAIKRHTSFCDSGKDSHCRKRLSSFNFEQGKRVVPCSEPLSAQAKQGELEPGFANRVAWSGSTHCQGFGLLQLMLLALQSIS